MEYNVEDISPIKKKITITVAPEEVEAAIQATVAIYRKSAQMDGFRKGKIPAAVVEKRYHDQIFPEAREDLINVHINEVMQKLDLTPVSGVDIKGDEQPLEHGKPFAYTMEFEYVPKFDLPPYEGLEVEEEEATAKPDEVDQVLERLRRERARLKPVEGGGLAVDGQVANIDFEAFENGQAVEGLKASNFDIELGKKQALPEFENLVKGIPVGNTGEGEVFFPEDFVAREFAGRTLNMKVSVNAIKEFDLPPLDDEFAKSLNRENLEQLREFINSSHIKTSQELYKGVAQKKLLDGLLKMTDFPVPPTLVDLEARMLVTDMAARLEQTGKSLAALGKTPKELLDDAKPRAEELARAQILLHAIAKKEGLSVSDDEVIQHIYQSSLTHGDDFKSTFAKMRDTGMIFQLRDKLLSDKAMDLVYAKAKVTMVPERPHDKDREAEEGQKDKMPGSGQAEPAQAEPAGAEPESAEPGAIAPNA